MRCVVALANVGTNYPAGQDVRNEESKRLENDPLRVDGQMFARASRMA